MILLTVDEMGYIGVSMVRVSTANVERESEERVEVGSEKDSRRKMGLPTVQRIDAVSEDQRDDVGMVPVRPCLFL